MSKKAEIRSQRHSANYFDRKADERRATSVIDQFNAEMDDLREQNAVLAERVAKLEAAYNKRGVYLNVERERNKELHLEIARLKKSRRQWIQGFLSRRRAHRKLSAIVRFALSPEQYHQAREILGDK